MITIVLGIRVALTFIGLKLSRIKHPVSFYINLKNISIEFLILIIPVFIVMYFMLKYSGSGEHSFSWVVIGTIGTACFTTYNFFIQPYVNYNEANVFIDDELIQEEVFKETGMKINVKVINKKITNAYATGIVNFTTLILLGKPLYDSLNRVELMGIVYHEVGHIKSKHLLKAYYMSLAASFLFCSSMVYFFPIIKAKIHIDTGLLVAIHAMVVYGGLKIMMDLIWRRFENEADRYAASVVGKENFINALEHLDKVSGGLLSKPRNLTHPSLNKRIQNVSNY